MVNLDYKFSGIIDILNRLKPFNPDIAIILGSGLGGFAKSVKIVKSIQCGSIESYPLSSVEGHSGFIHFAEYGNNKLLLFEGRIHFYEGFRLSDCLLQTHITHKLGCKYLIITNAAGGIKKELHPGSLMLNTSFNSMNIKNELTEVTGLADNYKKDNLLNCPSAELNNIIRNSAVSENIDLEEGVYWFNKGPAYETPAEVKMAEHFGGDAVGMSSAHEAIFAGSLGIKTASISLITNYAAGISESKLSHTEVIETSEKAKYIFENLVKRIILNL